jgi:hypothetical protein
LQLPLPFFAVAVPCFFAVAVACFFAVAVVCFFACHSAAQRRNLRFLSLLSLFSFRRLFIAIARPAFARSECTPKHQLVTDKGTRY